MRYPNSCGQADYKSLLVDILGRFYTTFRAETTSINSFVSLYKYSLKETLIDKGYINILAGLRVVCLGVSSLL